MLTLLKRFSWLVLTIILLAVGFIGGVFFGYRHALTTTVPTVLSNASVGQPQNVDFSLFWQAWNILNQKYAPTLKHPAVSDQDKVYGAIKGLAESFGDPYTTFFPPADEKQFQTQISGNFEGVGMEMGKKDGAITVIAPLKGSPAEKAGMKAGDIILKIGTTTTLDLTEDQAVALIRGKKGTVVTLTVLSQNEKLPHTVSITRDVINIPTIDTVARKDGIFVISLYTFTADSANLFRQALQKFVQSGDNKLILDLRGNPGGYLDAAVDMASWFLPADAVVVKEDSGGKERDVEYKSKGYNIFNGKLKMVILVDGGSASASEILSGALQEYGVAKLVGTKTFGKGSVQELVPLTSDTALKVTVARWLTPKGRSISEQGLDPDVTVQITQKDIDTKTDVQMNKAVELLLGK